MSPQVCALEEKVNHYSELFSFLLLLALFCLLLVAQRSAERGVVVVTGSLHAAGAALRLIDLEPV